MLFEQVRNVIVETLNCDAQSITPAARLAEDLGADSLDSVELNMALEDTMGIVIPDEELANLKTVQDIVSYVENHQK